ncbi:MAG: hypothetical protein QOF13_2358 [Solirubrobacterales bacterium]|jgi:hypothetical protein|nr:hypothetical protein [Solirubrobacterales bacterium]
MRRYLTWTLVLAGMIVVAAAGIATASKPVVVRGGNLILTLNGDVFPVALPEKTPAPITLKVSGSIATSDGSQPPALKKVVIDTAKDGYVNAKGLPVCTRGKLIAQSPQAAERACPASIVGRGHTTVRVAFPESTPFSAGGQVTAFNGGVKGPVTTLFIHAYVAVPAPTAVVTTVKIKRVVNGPYGLRSIARIPVIAGGYGSLTKFDLTIHRLFSYHGEQQSYLEGECHHDSQLAKVLDIFADGTEISGRLIRPCKVREESRP